MQASLGTSAAWLVLAAAFGVAVAGAVATTGGDAVSLISPPAQRAIPCAESSDRQTKARVCVNETGELYGMGPRV